MSEENYQLVVQAIPNWKPSRTQRTFGIEAIQAVIGGRFLDALAIKNRLHKERKVPAGYDSEICFVLDNHSPAAKVYKEEPKALRFIELF